MEEPCMQIVNGKDIDFGGMSLSKALQLTGNASSTDPACAV